MKVEEGLDAFIVIDGLPVVPEESKQKLVKFLLRKLNAVGHTSEDAVFMPINDKNMTEGCVREYGKGLCSILIVWSTDLRSLSMRRRSRPSPL